MPCIERITVIKAHRERYDLMKIGLSLIKGLTGFGMSVFIMLITWTCEKHEWKATELSLPDSRGKGFRLSKSSTGEIYASWIKEEERGKSNLLYATYQNGNWSSPESITQGGHKWHINWLDTPGLAKFNNGQMLASWLEYSSRRNPYDHHLMMSLSTNENQEWAVPFMPYESRIPAYYGLSKFTPLEDDKMLLLWQDGRDTKYEVPSINRFFPRPKSRIYLMGATLTHSGELTNEVVVDSIVSQLCPFNVVTIDDGAVVAYRDETQQGIKDIVVRHYTQGKWGEALSVYHDNWTPNYIITDAPVIDSNKEVAAIAWFSAPDKKGKIQIAFSFDKAKTFESPVQLDNGFPVGKVTMCLLKNNHALVSWIEKDKQQGIVMLAEVSPKGKILSKEMIGIQENHELPGIPSCTSIKNDALVVWRANETDLAGAIIQKQ